MTMFQVAALCRGFLYGLNTTEVNGQEEFLKLLEERLDHTSRARGLITGRQLVTPIAMTELGIVCFKRAK